MAELRRFFLRLFSFLGAAHAERDLDREIEAHLGLLEDDLRRQGMSAEEARRAALRALGGVDRTKESHRDARSFLWLDDARRDARLAVRGLLRDRGFACAALLTLAVGIGATTAIFGGVNAVLLRPLPLPQPERLLFLFEAGGVAGSERTAVTGPDFLDTRRDQNVFEHLAAAAPAPVTLEGSGEPERFGALRVSADYFRVLGTRPALGRDFTAGDDELGSPHTVLLGHALWRERFGGDPGLLGRTLILNGEPHTVIGVLPAGVSLAERAEQFYVPLALSPRERTSTGSRFLTVVARLRAGVSPAQAQAQMSTIAGRLQAIRPGSNKGVSLRLEGAREVLVGDLRRPLLFFLGAALFLLLIACANVANLQLVRSLARQREVAIRSALGAGRGRLIRQLTLENLVLAGLGGLGGLAMAACSAGLVPWLIPEAGPRMAGSFLDARVLACSAAVSLVTAMLFGLTPAWRLIRRDLRGQLAEGPRGAATTVGQRAGGLFAVVQIAVALLLLIGAGLSIRSFGRLEAVAPGFRTDHLLTFRLSLPDARYAGPERTELFHTRLVDELGALPGVTSAAGTSSLPLRGEGVGVSAHLEGRTAAAAAQTSPFLQYRAVTPVYFQTLGIPVLQGRGFTAEDGPGRTRVAVINRAAARRYWPEGDPIGARLRPDDSGGVVEIVGVVGDTRDFGLGAPFEPVMFLPLRQVSPSLWRWNRRTFDLVVGTAGAPEAVAASVRETVRRLDAGLPVHQVTSMEEVMADSLSSPRRSMALLLASGTVALVLAALGLYGVMAFLVAGRRQEIGVRVALGATPRRVLMLVLGRSVRLCALGIAVGVVAALGLSKVLSTLLFGVTATDGPTYAGIAALLLAVSMVAAYLPARRALRVDPLVALRGD
jgi:putative ABC transport system permease protein